MKRFIGRLVDASGRYAFAIFFASIVLWVGSFWYASHIELRSDFLELLPRDSPGFKAFEHQLGRVGGGASLIVINASPDRKSNEAFVDALAARLQKEIDDRKACGTDKKCGPDLIGYIEAGTKEVHAYFDSHKWLYADLDDLRNADDTLDHQIAVKSGLVDDLEGEDIAPKPPKSAPAPKGAAAPALPGASLGPPAPAAALKADAEAKPALGMDEFRTRWKTKATKTDDFPTGYFATPDGAMMGLRIVSNTRGMGESTADLLFARVKAIVSELDPKKFNPAMEVGYAGDIPNAVEEKDSLVSEAAWATGIAFVLILWGIVLFFRSIGALAVIGLPALIGVGAAYSFANATYGYVNTSGAFLGAIILGNGINYPIVLLARYNEFRARGMERGAARREAVWNAFRAELVGAVVGGIAYGSLIITNFRGFSQFGTIGFVGMLLVWVSMIPVVPAMIVVTEAAADFFARQLRGGQGARVPFATAMTRAAESLGPVLGTPLRGLAWLFPETRLDGGGGNIIRLVARATDRAPWAFVGAALMASAVCAWKLPTFLKDPWEYNFANLGSRGSGTSGAGLWSNRAEKVFGGKMNIAGALMLADTPEQVPLIKAQILENDAHDPQGKLVADVATVADLLPGTVEEQKKKLEVLDSIRERLTPSVVDSLSPEERARIDEMRPPEGLAPVTGKDLPALLRRRFEESNGTVGTVFYVRFKDISFSDGHILLRIAKTTDNVKLPGGKEVQTASRSTIFAEMIHSMERDGPLATFASLAAVIVVVLLATHTLRGAVVVIASLVMGVLWAVGFGALGGMKLNFLNFIALPITFGIGSEYPFNVFDRTRLLGGDVTAAVARGGGAVALCSFTTTVGYGSLLVADNQALESFGKLAMSGEVACLLAALFVLPSLLRVWRPAAARSPG